MEARRDWASWPWEARASVFLTAADLLAGRWRSTLNAATMLGQSKTCHQAEIDAACETIDFFRFNAHFAQQIYAEQPHSSEGVWNWADHRPLDGFVYAVSPFNFTAIGGNLTGSPALMGNAVVWKPSHSAVYSNYFVMRLLEEAGLPPGVINFVPGDPETVTRVVLDNEDFSGIHFTGSTAVFRSLWRAAAGNLPRYRSVSSHCRRDRRQGFPDRTRIRRRRSPRDRHAAGGVRVPGAEVQRPLARLHPGESLGTDRRPPRG